MKTKSIVIILATTIVLLSGTIYYMSRNDNNKDSIVTDLFVAKDNFTTDVDQDLIDTGINYVRHYNVDRYVALGSAGSEEVDVDMTFENYKCSYTLPAKDDENLYLNLTCIGDAYDTDGNKLDIGISSFSENPTRLQYKVINGDYAFTKIDQPISPQVFSEALPEEYIELLGE